MECLGVVFGNVLIVESRDELTATHMCMMHYYQ